MSIGGTEDSLLRYVDSAGEIQGMDVDIFREIMRRMNFDFTVHLFKSTARLERSWQDGRYDMVFSHSYNPERAKYLLYPKQSHLFLEWHFFMRKENKGRFQYDTLEDLKGLRIGVTKSFSYTSEFWKRGREGWYSLDEVTVNKLNLNKLLLGRIDLWPNGTLGTLYRARTEGYADQIDYLPKPLKSGYYFNTFVRRSPRDDIPALAEKYDRALSDMKKDGSLAAIYLRYGFELNPELLEAL
ncbi:ABC transporter substrate-binding protein [Hahella sp. CCB-MM4]|uniref:substrate-binding periplasmic protein n=1 Tax=Hahella sp. (strain CCB-MM4) TaxID=1926491 RepID=UPI00143CF6A9|nr:transporter substrate-binding domain-containing protein [Hahella sp. CCB-MM4]